MLVCITCLQEYPQSTCQVYSLKVQVYSLKVQVYSLIESISACAELLIYNTSQTDWERSK